MFNVALGKTTTSNSSNVSNLNLVTDGDHSSFNYANETSGTTGKYYQVDLGAEYLIDTIGLWRYWEDRRIYHDVVVRTSTNATFATDSVTVFNNNVTGSLGFGIGKSTLYRERSTGRRIEFAPTLCRYIRVYANGSDANLNNHLVEVETWTASEKRNNLAYRKNYTKSINPSNNFPDTGLKSTDGQLAMDLNTAYGYETNGYVNLEIVIDLEVLQMINLIRYHQYAGYFYQPDAVSAAVSTDGVNFTVLGMLPLVGSWREISFNNMTARWVKVVFSKTYNQWGDDWMFVDEIQVYGPDSNPPFNVALGKQYLSSMDPSSTYPDTGGIELTDNKYATKTYIDAAWQGRMNQPVYSHVIDLGDGIFKLKEITANYYQDTTVGIWWPDSVSVDYSVSGIDFTPLGVTVPGVAYGTNKKYKKYTLTVTTNPIARYVRVTVNNSHETTFSDEIQVIAQANVAYRKTYTASMQANPTYPDEGGLELTDGIYAVGNYLSGGWQGRDSPTLLPFYFTFDLSAVYSVAEMNGDFYDDTGLGIYWPSLVKFATSSDGVNFTNLGTAIAGDPYGYQTRNKKWTLTLTNRINTRYIRMTVTPAGQWTFQSEVEIWAVLNVAQGRPYTTSVPAHPAYTDSNNSELTDGVAATENYLDTAWSGRLNQPQVYTIIDLGSKQKINKFSANFLQDLGVGIYWPQLVTYAVSIDNIAYTDLGSYTSTELHGPTGKLKRFVLQLVNAVSARWVKTKVMAANTQWVFTDEIEVWNVQGYTNPTSGMSSLDIPKLVPYPQNITINTGTLTLTNNSRITYIDPTLSNLAAVVATEIQALTGLVLAVTSGPSAANDIALDLSGTGTNEDYTLNITDRVTVSAATYKSLALATSTLLQSMDATGMLKKVSITDSTTMKYRAIMIDVARQRHTISTLKKLIILCRFYKISFLHVHLTDHNAWTFPSTAYPNLGTNNTSVHGGIIPVVYTITELTDLVAWADIRGVTLIPEISSPGHCSIMVADYPSVFGGYNSQGQLVSAFFPNAVSETTYSAVSTLINEVAAIFTSSPYICIGGDEGQLAGIDSVVGYTDFLAAKGLANADELYAYWIDRMRAYVEATGKLATSWEGGYSRAAASSKIARSLIYINWLGSSYRADDMCSDGFTVINQPWNTSSDYELSVYSFSNGTNGENIEVTFGMPVLGASFPLWEMPETAALPVARIKAAARMERAWKPFGSEGYKHFDIRVSTTDTQLTTLLTLA